MCSVNKPIWINTVFKVSSGDARFVPRFSGYHCIWFFKTVSETEKPIALLSKVGDGREQSNDGSIERGVLDSQKYPTNHYMINNLEDFVVFLVWKVLIMIVNLRQKCGKSQS